MKRRNCWEHMDCGREPGGAHADERGVCPAATETRLDGVHGGVSAGRACWAVAGTVAGANLTCSRSGGDDCFICEFYRSVLSEESPNLVFTPAIVSLLQVERAGTGWLRDFGDQ